MSRTVRTVPDEQIIAKPAAEVGMGDRARQANMSSRMKQKLAEEPKEKIRIRPEDGSQHVQFNGYTYRIFPSEKYVSVPRSVAEELRGRGVV